MSVEEGPVWVWAGLGTWAHGRSRRLIGVSYRDRTQIVVREAIPFATTLFFLPHQLLHSDLYSASAHACK